MIHEHGPTALGEYAAYEWNPELSQRCSGGPNGGCGCPSCLGRLGDTSAESASEPEWGGGHPLEAELESEEGYQYETPARKPIEIGPVVICGGKPFAVLDAFRFNVSALRRDGVRDHPA